MFTIFTEGHFLYAYIHTYKKAAKNSFGFYSCTIHSMGNADLAMATDKIKFIPQCLSIQKAAIKLDVAPKSICVPNSFYFIIFNFFCNPSNSWTVQAWSKAVTKRHLWNCQELRFRPESKSYKPQPWVLSPEQRHLRRPWNSLHNQPFVHWHWPQCQLAISVCSSAKDTDTHTHGEHIMINRENCCKQTVNLFRKTEVILLVVFWKATYFKTQPQKHTLATYFHIVQLGAEIPGIDAMLYQLGLYSLLGVWSSEWTAGYVVFFSFFFFTVQWVKGYSMSTTLLAVLVQIPDRMNGQGLIMVSKFIILCGAQRALYRWSTRNECCKAGSCRFWTLKWYSNVKMRYIVEMRSNSVHEEGYACANVFVWLCMVQWGKKTKQKQAAVPVCMEREPRDCMVINLLSNISQNPLPLFTVMAFYMYPKHADMSMHSNLKTARNSLLLKLSNHTKGTTNFAKNKVGRYTLWILRELGAEPTDIPELFPGDKHLGQTLQLGSLLLHGVPDAVHLSTETRSKGQGGLCFYASKCASLLFRWQTHKESPDWTKAWRRSVRWWQTMHWHLGFCLPFKHHGERWG